MRNVCCPEPAGGTVRCPASHPHSWNRGDWSWPVTEIGPRRACRAPSASGPDTKDFHVPSGSHSSLSPWEGAHSCLKGHLGVPFINGCAQRDSDFTPCPGVEALALWVGWGAMIPAHLPPRPDPLGFLHPRITWLRPPLLLCRLYTPWPNTPCSCFLPLLGTQVSALLRKAFLGLQGTQCSSARAC